MQTAVTLLAPALAPLAIKLIDKYIFDDDRPAAPQIVTIPASPQCRCCEYSTDGYTSSTDRTCSTCYASKSSAYRPSKNGLSTKSTRCSSTSDAYDREKTRSSSCTYRTRRSSDSTVKSLKNSEQQYTRQENTLDILAGNLKKEIIRQRKGIPSHCFSNSGIMENKSSKYKITTTDTANSSGSRNCCSGKSRVPHSKGSSRTSNRNSYGSKVSKT